MYVRPSGCWIFAEAVRQDEEVDYLIFDCPPGFTAASMAALRAADEVVIPMELDGFSIYGLSTLAEQLANLRRRGAKARVAGVLITKKQKHGVFPKFGDTGSRQRYPCL